MSRPSHFVRCPRCQRHWMLPTSAQCAYCNQRKDCPGGCGRRCLRESILCDPCTRLAKRAALTASCEKCGRPAAVGRVRCWRHRYQPRTHGPEHVYVPRTSLTAFVPKLASNERCTHSTKQASVDRCYRCATGKPVDPAIAAIRERLMPRKEGTAA